MFDVTKSVLVLRPCHNYAHKNKIDNTYFRRKIGNFFLWKQPPVRLELKKTITCSTPITNLHSIKAGGTPLDLAVIRKNIEAIKLLFRCKELDINIKNFKV